MNKCIHPCVLRMLHFFSVHFHFISYNSSQINNGNSAQQRLSRTETFTNNNVDCEVYGVCRLTSIFCVLNFVYKHIHWWQHPRSLPHMHDARFLVDAMNGITDTEQENMKIQNKNVFHCGTLVSCGWVNLCAVYPNMKLYQGHRANCQCFILV